MILIRCLLCGFMSILLAATVSSFSECQYSTNQCVKKSFIDWIFELHSRNSDLSLLQCPVKTRLYSRLCDWWLPGKQLLAEVFPIDPETKNFVRRVKNVLFSQTYTTPLEGSVMLAAWSDDVLCNLLNLDPAVTQTTEFLNVVSGRTHLNSVIPLTHRYGGHQFGIWADQLGDGRAHLIGEYTNWQGRRYEINLKGSGKTPYSRKGDGRAIVRSSVREFLASEAMHWLGIPTSRCATLITSSDTVKRDLLYSGKLSDEKTAVVLRIAPSWFRFGSVEILAKDGELNLLQKLLDFIIEHYFKEISVLDPTRYLQLFSVVVEQTAEMIARWQGLGFVHGVCNTDNFSILSIIIDYGPFQFMDAYDPELVPNVSDDEGRYSYKRQPEVGFYNLEKLAESLRVVIQKEQQPVISMILSGYNGIYQAAFLRAFRRKLGLLVGHGGQDEQLVLILLRMMEQTEADFTMTFRQLAEISIDALKAGYISKKQWALKKLCEHPEFQSWVALYSERLEGLNLTEEIRKRTMLQANPKYILRNWMAEAAIDAVNHNDFQVVQNLTRILQKPFEDQKEADELGYAEPPPWWASDIKISCAS